MLKQFPRDLTNVNASKNASHEINFLRCGTNVYKIANSLHTKVLWSYTISLSKQINWRRFISKSRNCCFVYYVVYIRLQIKFASI